MAKVDETRRNIRNRKPRIECKFVRKMFRNSTKRNFSRKIPENNENLKIMTSDTKFQLKKSDRHMGEGGDRGAFLNRQLNLSYEMRSFALIRRLSLSPERI